MLVDPNTGQHRPHSQPHKLHDYLMLDKGGTGLFHASFEPDHLGEHAHQPHQITVLFNNASVTSSWHSATGRQLQQRVRVGQCYIVPSEQPHGLSVDRAGELVNLYLAPEAIAQAMPESTTGRSLNFGDLQVTDDPFIQQLAATIRADCITHGKACKLLVESAIAVLVFHLVHHYAKNSVKLPHLGALSTNQLVKVKEFIAAEGNRDITIANMAQIIGYSTVHFSRMFKQATGQTPRQYLIRYRINQAKQLLKTTELSIVTIAYQVGFGSHAHFSTQFHQLVGVTPQMYRAGVRF